MSAAMIRARAGAARNSRSATVRPPERGTWKSERGTVGAGAYLTKLAVTFRVPRSALFGYQISRGTAYVFRMPLRLSEHPAHDRPRERLWSVGPAALTGQELLAVLLGTGCTGRDALVVAGEMLAVVDGSVRRLAGRPLVELARIPGGGRSQAARVAAALELGRRVGSEAEQPPERIRGPADVQRVYATRLRDLVVEEFHVLALGSQSQILGDRLITRGILNSSLVHPREVFRAAIAEAAAGIIVVHNHPSGDPTPSADDRAVTRQLVDAGRLLDLPVYDHVIVGGDRYVSFAEAGLL